MYSRLVRRISWLSMQRDIRARVSRLHTIRCWKTIYRWPLIMRMVKRRLQLRKKKIIIRLTILQMLNLPLMAAREISWRTWNLLPCFLTRKMRLREISTRKACPAATMFTMKYPGMARSWFSIRFSREAISWLFVRIITRRRWDVNLWLRRKRKKLRKRWQLQK